ncbi:MAG TPA: hypothetical protein VFH78_09595 [Candidatus Thermoplasmatota archaeon]|nr:hypothetical protein [Candidatus Thermoplasmatota archaeon]
MDLLGVRGIGPLYREKLEAAGVRSAEALAWVDDLPALAARTDIPVGRLAALQAEAVRAVGRQVRPPPIALRSALASVLHLARTVRDSRPLSWVAGGRRST